MEITSKQKQIKERREYVISAYNDNEELSKTGDRSKYMAKSVLVQNLARKFKITTVQVYNDIKAMSATKEVE